MSKRIKKIIKLIVIICIIVLIIDFGILIYHHFFKEEETSYFDSINSFEMIDTGIIAVGSNTNNDKGYEKSKITLYDSNYQKVWETLYNKKYNSSFFAVKQDKDNYIAVGNYEANKQEHEENVRSACIVIFSKDGSLLAEKKFQVLGNSKFTNLLVVDDGYIVVGQSIYENMTLGVSDEGGAFIIKYDKELNEVWKHNYGGSKSGLYNDLVIANDFIYTVGKDSSRLGIISKYTLEGEYISTSTYEITDTLGFTGIEEVNNCLFAVGARKISEDQDDYDTDALIVKYDSDLNKISEKTYTGDGMERYNTIMKDSNSNLVLSGQTGIYNKSKSTAKLNVFSYNGIIAKYSKNLDELLVQEYDLADNENHYFTDIKEQNNNYIISGYSSYDNSYIAKFIIYTKSGKLIGAK